MSETTRLTNEYIEITKQDIEAHERTAKEANEYIRNSTAQYHGRCVKALYAVSYTHLFTNSLPSPLLAPVTIAMFFFFIITSS